MLKDNLTEDQIRSASGYELLTLVNKYVLELSDFKPEGFTEDTSRPLTLDMTYCFREIIPAMRKRDWYLQLQDCNHVVVIRFETEGSGDGEIVYVTRDESEATGVLRASLLAVLSEGSSQ